MAYNPIPNQKKYQSLFGNAVAIAGIVVFVIGVIAEPLSPDIMLWGACLAGAGQLISAFAE